MTDVNDKQIGGDHYKKASFQPWDWNRYGVGGLEWTAIKYITRFKNKDGIQDLEKAKHYIEKTYYEYADHGLINNSRRRPVSEMRTLFGSFAEQNQLNETQRVAVWNILQWHNELSLKLCMQCIDDLIKSEYP